MVLAAAAGTYLVACGLGLAARAGRRPARWLHHAAYAAVLATTAAALTAGAPPVLWVVLAAMGLLPRFRAGGAAHGALALVGAVGYAAACVASWN